jgi:hypothetical protein
MSNRELRYRLTERRYALRILIGSVNVRESLVVGMLVAGTRERRRMCEYSAVAFYANLNYVV